MDSSFPSLTTKFSNLGIKMTFDSKNLATSIAKAFLFDTVVTVGLTGIKNSFYAVMQPLTEIFTGALTAYTFRDIGRDHGHPWIAGGIFGAIKYWQKESHSGLGGYNNFGYEFSNDIKVSNAYKDFKDNISPMLIEGVEEGYSRANKTYHANGTTSEVIISGVNGFGYGSLIGASVVGLASVFYEPLVKGLVSLSPVVTGPIAFLSIGYTGYRVGTALGDCIIDLYKQPGTVDINPFDQMATCPANTIYSNLVAPIFPESESAA